MTKHMTCDCNNCHESKLSASPERKKYFKREANRALRRVINRTNAWENPLEVVRARDLWGSPLPYSTCPPPGGLLYYPPPMHRIYRLVIYPLEHPFYYWWLTPFLLAAILSV
jgi:hypothetical protein